MGNMEIKNDGIKILSSMLNKWRKENNSNSVNYIFFPKFIENVDGIYMVFPIYEELDKNTAKLISKINLALIFSSVGIAFNTFCISTDKFP